MATNGAPDNWDDGMDVSNKMEALNVNAPSFVPNVNAPSFVPSWGAPPPVVSTPETAPEDKMQVDQASAAPEPAPVTGNGPGRPAPAPADSWEDKADLSSTATTPEDEDMSMEDDTGVKKAARVKNKPVKEAESVTTEKEHVNIVFIGHVDAGKSTIGGQLMYLTNMVDKRTLEKYEKEAKDKNRETWYLSWCMDTNQEERDKGKTVEVGRAYFETEKKHFTILDAPGHKSYVPNMIGGASQADLAVLVISARKGEFETGFERGGQTREHAMLVKTAGVKHLVILINKMDDPTVKWSKERYDYCKDQLTPYLKRVGFNPAKDIHFLPCSGLNGSGIKNPVGDDFPSYTGLPFIQYLDDMPSLKRQVDGPFMMPIVDKYNDMGTIVIGKVESGGTKKGDQLLVMPNRTDVKVEQIWSDDIEVTAVTSGENIKIKIKGIDDGDVSPGFVLCSSVNPITTGKVFDAQIVMLDLKSIVCAGFGCMMHLQAMAEEVTIKALICLVDRKTGEKSKTRPRFIKQDQIAIVRFVASHPICMETFKDHPQLGRFTLRDEGTTIAIGKILKIVE